MKKISQKATAIILAMLMLFSIAPFISICASAEGESDFTFKLINEDTEYEVSGCSDELSGAVVIPATYNSLPVTSIGSNAFYESNNIASVVIPEGVTKIGRSAFQSCYKLESVILPDSLKQIGSYAFCDTKIKSITIPAGVTSIDTNAFSGSSYKEINVASENASFSSVDGVLFNKAQTEIIRYPSDKEGISYEIPNTVTEIGENAFSGCQLLRTVIIPNSVTTIRYGAFAFSNSLESITIPDSVVTLEGRIFYVDINLQSVTIGKGVTEIDAGMFWCCRSLEALTISPENNAFSMVDGVVFNSDKTTLIYCLPGKDTLNYIVPDGVTTINRSAFAYCTKIKGITFPASLSKIEDGAFYSCGIESAYIPANITDIPGSIFGSCTSLLAIEIDPENPSYKSIDGVMYSKDGSTLLAYPIGRTESIYEVIPGVTKVKNAFSYSQNLRSVYFPYGVTQIGVDTFYWSESIESVYIPSTVTEIEDSAFRCWPLTDVYFGGTQEEWDAITVATYANEELAEANLHCNSKYTVTWNVDGTETTADYEYGEAIDRIDDPEKEGYTFVGWNMEIPATMPANNLTVTANFEVNTYKVKWVVNDEITALDYTYGDPIVVPANPTIAAGYAFAGWSEEIPSTMPARDMTFYAEFYCITIIEINNNPGTKTINYGEGIKFTATATDMPEGAKIVWYVNDKKAGEGESFTFSDAKADATITVKIVDKDGDVMKDATNGEISASEKVTVKAGFFQKLISFFKNLFKANRIIAQAIVNEK